VTDAKASPSGGEAWSTGGDAAAVWSQIVSIWLGASDRFLVCGMTVISLSVLARRIFAAAAKALLAARVVAASGCACSLGMTLVIRRLA
jgi:hypothetical protein